MEELVIGNEELRDCPPLEVGDAVTCPHCGEQHTVHLTTVKDGSPGEIMYYKCPETGRSHIAGYKGKFVMDKVVKNG